MEDSDRENVESRMRSVCLRAGTALVLLPLLGGCTQDLAGTYVGTARETMRTSAAERKQQHEGASVTIDVGRRDRVVLRYGDCELPGIIAQGGGSVALSQSLCDVRVADRGGEALMFGSVDRRGSRISVLVNGTLESDDERSVYTYRFEGERPP